MTLSKVIRDLQLGDKKGHELNHLDIVFLRYDSQFFLVNVGGKRISNQESSIKEGSLEFFEAPNLIEPRATILFEGLYYTEPRKSYSLVANQ